MVIIIVVVLFVFFLANSRGMGKDQRTRIIGAIRYDGTGNGFDKSDECQGSETGIRRNTFPKCQS